MIRLPRTAVVATAVLSLWGVASCAARAGDPAAVAPTCQQPAEAVLPDAAGTLDETSTGTYCLAAGQVIDVFLHAKDPKKARWTAIASSDPAILAPQRTGVLTPVLGVTPGIFGGLKPGTANLSSAEPGGASWTVTIIVQ